MNKPRILIEDKAQEAAYLQKTLSEFRYEVVGIAEDLDSAYAAYVEKRPNICVVDRYLHGKPMGLLLFRKSAMAMKGCRFCS